MTGANATGDVLRRRIEKLAGGAPYRAYLEARDAVLRMQELMPGERVSEYWREELAGFEYMLDASPLLVEKLRHHTFHVTGLKTYDYRTGKDELRARLEHKLRMLREAGDPSLFVPEARELGGFGFELDGELVNIDTLKFYEVLIALDHGAVLPALREQGPRRLVCEIGAGWGGFARAWKTIVPQTTYVIVDLPELFLFSGTYLQALFPDAAIRYWAGEDAAALFEDWESVDFIMVPSGALPAARPPRIDLTLNMVSFQEMTSEQVRGYVEHAHEVGSPFLYSLNRDRSLYNRELTSVRQIMAARFRLHEIPVLHLPYTKLPRVGPSGLVERALEQAGDPSGNEYRHIVGWHRP
jgi:putative sugar O-methyltransferase